MGQYVYTGPKIINMLLQQINLLCMHMGLWLLLYKLDHLRSSDMVVADVIVLP